LGKNTTGRQKQWEKRGGAGAVWFYGMKSHAPGRGMQQTRAKTQEQCYGGQKKKKGGPKSGGVRSRDCHNFPLGQGDLKPPDDGGGHNKVEAKIKGQAKEH